jgi:D-alanine-D-alanine ligase
MTLRLGIIYGGKSSEHEVSLSTAFAIIKAADKSRYQITPIYIRLDGTWVKGTKLENDPASAEELRLEGSYADQPNILTLKNELDIVFPVIHGPNGEDGTLQGLLEMIDLPYVGAGVLGSALGMDKVAAKNVFGELGLPQGKYLSFLRKRLEGELEAIVGEVEQNLGYPCFVKPANMGSSVGISKAKDREGLISALRLAAQFDRKVIVEEFISGRELEIGVLGNEDLKTSVIGEIISVNEFYDYEAKYKNAGTKLNIPAQILDETAREMRDLAMKAFRALDEAGLSRVDFFFDEKKNQLYINEINTMPGFTPYSMYPMLFKEAGIPYSELIDELIRLGLERYRDKGQAKIVAERLDR